MATKPKTVKAPKLLLKTGKEASDLRRNLKQNQSEFWARISVSQSTSSRYENGREIPPPVRLLLHLAYAPETQALALLNFLRAEKAK